MVSTAPASSKPLLDPTSTPTNLQDLGGHTGTRGCDPQPGAPRRPSNVLSVPGWEPPSGGCGERPAPPGPPLPVTVKPEKASPLAPPGLGSAPGHPGRASLTGPTGAASSSQRPTLERRSLCNRKPSVGAQQIDMCLEVRVPAHTHYRDALDCPRSIAKRVLVTCPTCRPTFTASLYM